MLHQEIGGPEDEATTLSSACSRSGAVGALRDRAPELELLQRIIVGMRGRQILVGVIREAARQRPQAEHAVPPRPKSQCSRRT
jgi:hypothetical protein